MSQSRTYRGKSLEEILPRIRAELGPDAVITRQREGLAGGIGGFFQKKFVEVDAPILIAEPGFADGTEYERHDHRHEQRDDIFDEQRAVRAGRGKPSRRGQRSIYAH